MKGAQSRVWLGALLALIVGLQVPAVAARLNPQGATSFARVYLWQASLNMFGDHPWLGVHWDRTRALDETGHAGRRR